METFPAPGAQVPSGPLQHQGALPSESPDTRKEPHRIPHGILSPLVSGTQHLLQSNRAGSETALIREAEKPASSGSQFPSCPYQHRGTLLTVSPDTRKDPQRIPHGILRPLVSGTQHLKGGRFEHQISGHHHCKKKACLQRIL